MLFASALVCTLAIAHAEEPRGIVEGFVRDGKGNPLQGVNVDVDSREVIKLTGDFRYIPLSGGNDRG